MKTYLSIISSILFLFGCHSEKFQIDNFDRYNSLIEISRKLAYEEQNLSKSIKSYKLAFKEIKNPFGLDYLDALKVASINKDYEFGTTILEEICKRGCPPKIVEQYSKKYLDFDSTTWNLFAENLSVYQKYYDSNFDVELRQELLNLRYLDSTFNAEFHASPIDSIYSTNTTKEISKKLKQLEELSKFPCESNVGLFYNDQGIVSSPISIILMHQYQRGDTIFLNRIEKLAGSGLIDKTSIGMYKQYQENLPAGRIGENYRRGQLMKWNQNQAKKELGIEFLNN